MSFARSQGVMPRRRGAFTLIELLVVIAIIATLAALLLAGVMAVMSKPAALQTRTDISQLATSVGKFKQTYNILPPHYIRLRSRASEYNTGLPIDNDSISFIRKWFPNIGDFGNTTPAIAWDGNAPFAPGGFEDLGPDQCLVFFLGGIPDFSMGAPPLPPDLMGFAQSGKDPASPGLKDKTLRKGPFYTFPTSRLVQVNPTSRFYAYKDAYGVLPYILFSSTHNYGSRNTPIYTGGLPVAGYAPGGPFTVRPFEQTYPSTTHRFLNPDSFQIVSGGADKKFGPGGTWSANNSKAYSGVGADDVANFSENLLGSQ